MEDISSQFINYEQPPTYKQDGRENMFDFPASPQFNFEENNNYDFNFNFGEDTPAMFDATTDEYSDSVSNHNHHKMGFNPK